MAGLPEGYMVRVSGGWFCYGLICRDGYVVWAPDIAKWMQGKPEAVVHKWLVDKGATFTVYREEKK